MDHITFTENTAFFHYTDTTLPAEIYDGPGSYTTAGVRGNARTNSTHIFSITEGSSDKDILWEAFASKEYS